MITNLSQDLSPLEARSCSMCRVTTRRNLRSKFIEILFLIIMRLSSLENIAKGTTDPGVDCFDQYFGLVGLVQYA